MKKPSLFAPATPIATALENPVLSETEAVAASKRPPSREGKRVLSVYLPPEAWKQLRMLAVNMETSTQDLGQQAINMLFEKHRLNRIA
jgi:Antitoxin-like ribbon-helix-helix